MSQATVNAGGLNIVLDFGNKNPLPTIDPVSGSPWNPQPRQPGQVASLAAQPGTFDNNFTAPQANQVIFRNPA